MKSISNSVTGALKGTKAKKNGAQSAITDVSFYRISSQGRSHVTNSKLC